MATTIQINEKTLWLLKRIKEETHSLSYDEAINKIAIQRIRKKSMAGYLSKYYEKKELNEILKDLRDENERF